MPTVESFMKMAIALAEENAKTGNGGPFGALVVKDGEIVGRGANHVTTANDPTAHAEVNAIRDACKNLNTFQLDGCELYSSCEPCPMCLGAIYWARLDKLYYSATRNDAADAGFDDSFIYDQMNIPNEERSLNIECISLQSAQKVFDDWKKNTEKTPY